MTSVRLRLDHIDHQPDDVPGRAELAVDARRGEFAEQVLVEVALGVALGERQPSIMLTADTSRLGFWIISWASFMYSANVFFVASVPFPLPPRPREVGKELVPHDLQHIVATAMLEPATSGYVLAGL